MTSLPPPPKKKKKKKKTPNKQNNSFNFLSAPKSSYTFIIGLLTNKYDWNDKENHPKKIPKPLIIQQVYSSYHL